MLLGTFLSSIEVTIVSAAMPSIVEALGGLALYPWVFTTYILAQTVTIPIYGRLADLWGRRRTYAVGVSLFLMGSLLSGAAPSMEALVAARLLQGLGAGSLLPLTMTIFGDLYAVAERTRIQGVFSLVWGLSAILGPTTGGALVMAGSWRAIFLLNLPFGILATATILWLLPEPADRRRQRLDLGGMATLSLGLIALMVALMRPDERPGPAWPWALAAVAMLGAFLAIERRHPQPTVPLELFRDRVQATVNVAGVVMGVVLFGVVGFLPLFIQGVLGASPMWAGAALIPMALSWTVGSVLAGRLLYRFGFRGLVRTGAISMTLGTVGLSVAMRHPDPVLLAGALVLTGLGFGFCVSSFTVSVQERARPEHKGIATALSQFARSIGATVGVAVLGAIMTRGLGEGVDLDQLVADGLGSPELAALLEPAMVQVFAVVTGAGVTAGAVILLAFPTVRLRAAQREGRMMTAASEDTRQTSPERVGV
ncbi:MAG: MFS transporter [Alphaproteobacteria bacterium]|nr:MFS transporter [Alphaproteobacteria bacterium]